MFQSCSTLQKSNFDRTCLFSEPCRIRKKQMAEEPGIPGLPKTPMEVQENSLLLLMVLLLVVSFVLLWGFFWSIWQRHYTLRVDRLLFFPISARRLDGACPMVFPCFSFRKSFTPFQLIFFMFVYILYLEVRTSKPGSPMFQLDLLLRRWPYEADPGVSWRRKNGRLVFVVAFLGKAKDIWKYQFNQIEFY